MRRALVLAAVLLWSSDTLAFTTSSAFTAPCHETMTLGAMSVAGWPDGAEPPPLDETGRRISEDSFFPLPAGWRDAWTLALVEGVRQVDINGHDVADLANIAAEAADPEKQRDHCLRAPWDDGPEGDGSALRACRAYIREQVEAALGSGDEVDMSATVVAEVALVFRGNPEIALNRYGFHMGMAAHALQDSFSHAFRTDDGTRVRHVLDYVDYVGSDYDEARDGHRHESGLDRCGDGLAAQDRRMASGATATAQLLAAAADPEGGRMGRLERVETVLDTWLGQEPGCTVENGYCDATELKEPALGACAAQPGPAGGTGLAAAALGMLVLARRRRYRVAGVTVLLLVSRTAQAEEPDPQEDSEIQRVVEEVEEPGREVVAVNPEENEAVIIEKKTVEADDEGAPVNRGFGFYLGGGGSLDQASAFVTGGIRIDVVRWLTIGIDGEYNPWFSIEGERTSAGTTNIYVPLVFTWATVGPIEFHSTLAGGVSVLNFDLPGADAGSVGPFVSTTPVGIAIRAARPLRVVIDPGGLTLSVPQMEGIPLIYRQHRLAVGLRWTF